MVVSSTRTDEVLKAIVANPTMQFKILNRRTGDGPGSKEALARGCACPRAANRDGAGWAVSDSDSRRGFWIDRSCRLHRRLVSSR